MVGGKEGIYSCAEDEAVLSFAREVSSKPRKVVKPSLTRLVIPCAMSKVLWTQW
jgi:hypothetical protein